MGLLVEGVWHDQWYDTKSNKGKFVRQASRFRNWITIDGQPGPTGEGGFEAAANRYHLYVSYACPWAHRVLIFRALKKLEDVIPISVVSPDMLENGWEYASVGNGTADENYHFKYHHQLYTKADPEYTGRVTVPVLWDKQKETIVNNESSEIIRMLNSAFAAYTDDQTNYCPDHLLTEIDEINEFVYDSVNNGVYRCGFATTQEAYGQAFDQLFAALDDLESRLSQHRYLIGSLVTEADWRLFTTLIRFDVVYYGHFKTNLRQIADYPNLSNYVRDLYQYPRVAETVNFEHIKRHYYYSHQMVNPTRVVPKGPEYNYHEPHDRERFT
ncbi:MAG: glutathione S-transferase family protein [SAR324 cluster bacterium]|nr:glutathione S-transferase family protein [SAR324 cluster bacterium]